ATAIADASADAGCGPDFQSCSAGCCRRFLVERVDPPIGAGGAQYPSLAFDAQGNPHVAYRDASDEVLMYATRAGGTWTIEEIDDKFFGPDYSLSLALDPSGGVHIAYLSDHDNIIHYASRIGGSWIIETLDDGKSHDGWVSLAIDGLGVAHVSYF